MFASAVSMIGRVVVNKVPNQTKYKIWICQDGPGAVQLLQQGCRSALSVGNSTRWKVVEESRVGYDLVTEQWWLHGET